MVTRGRINEKTGQSKSTYVSSAPVLLTEQAPQIAPFVGSLPIMLRNSNICGCNLPWVGIQCPYSPPQQAV